MQTTHTEDQISGSFRQDPPYCFKAYWTLDTYYI